MVRGDKNIFQQSSPAGGSAEDGGEIEKIIKEIEDLEKSMDAPQGKAEAGNSNEAKHQSESSEDSSSDLLAEASAETGGESSGAESDTTGFDEEESGPSPFDSSVEEAIAKSDMDSPTASPKADIRDDDDSTSETSNRRKVTHISTARKSSKESLDTSDDSEGGFDGGHSSVGSSGNGNLGLKIQGLNGEITLDFERAGVAITLVCTGDGLKIKTNQGAEFRLPFKKAA